MTDPGTSPSPTRRRPYKLAFAMLSLACVSTASDSHGAPSITVGVVAVLTITSCVVRARHDRAEWRTWYLATGGIASATGAYGALLAGQGPSAVLPNLLFLMSFPLVIMAVFLLVRRRSVRRGVGHWLDGLTIGAAFGCVLLTMFGINFLADARGKGPWRAFLVFAYPTLDVAFAASVVVALAQVGLRVSPQLRAMLAASCLLIAADLVPLFEETNGRPIGIAPNLVVAAYLCVIIATRLVTAAVVGDEETNQPIRALMVPWFATAMAFFVLIGRSPALPIVTDGLAALTLVAALSRMSLAYREIRRLERSRREARTDDLTALPNRRALREDLERVVMTTSPASVFIMDLDGFKEVNDTMGHDAGDELLSALATRLNAVAESFSARLFRLGGDEFASVIDDVDDDNLKMFAESLRLASAEPIVIHGVRMRQNMSVGGARFPSDAAGPSELLRLADTAMYRAKSSHSGFAMHDLAQLGRSDHLELTAEVRDAVERGAIDVYFQPQIRLADLGPHGVEALLRVTIASGPVPAPHVIEICEQVGLLEHLTDLVLERSLSELRNWMAMGHRLIVSINVSARDIASGRLVARVAGALQRHRVDPTLVCLEFTEEALFGNTIQVLGTVSGLRSLGVKISLDDFGVGFSSLSNLRSIHVDDLKIDRSFVTELVGTTVGNERTRALVDSMVTMAAKLGAVVIAEGVETAAEAEQVVAAGIPVAQGYLFGRPMPVDAVTAWLDDEAQARSTQALSA